MQAENRESLQFSKDGSKDGSVIDTLVRETGCERAHVKELYDRAFAQLEASAKLKGFLSLLAFRNVRVELRKAVTPA